MRRPIHELLEAINCPFVLRAAIRPTGFTTGIYRWELRYQGRSIPIDEGEREALYRAMNNRGRW